MYVCMQRVYVCINECMHVRIRGWNLPSAPNGQPHDTPTHTHPQQARPLGGTGRSGPAPVFLGAWRSLSAIAAPRASRRSARWAPGRPGGGSVGDAHAHTHAHAHTLYTPAHAHTRPRRCVVCVDSPACHLDARYVPVCAFAQAGRPPGGGLRLYSVLKRVLDDAPYTGGSVPGGPHPH
jgi:hypothetical protein